MLSGSSLAWVVAMLSDLFWSKGCFDSYPGETEHVRTCLKILYHGYIAMVNHGRTWSVNSTPIAYLTMMSANNHGY